MAQQALFLAAPVAGGLRGAFVVVFLALTSRDLELHEAFVVEIHHQRHDGHALAFGRIPQAHQFLALAKELALAPFLVAEHGPIVGCDIGVGEPKFTVINARVAFGDVGLPKAQRFDFGAVQDNADFDIFLDGIIVACAPIFREDLVVLVIVFACHGVYQIGDGAGLHKRAGALVSCARGVMVWIGHGAGSDMFVQIAIGSCLLLASILIAGVSFWMMEWAFVRHSVWLARPPHRPKLILVLVVAAIWILAQVTAGVWMWAFAFVGLGVFETLELAVYFSLVSFMTLGFGDVLLPVEWRLLAGMAAANGLLNFGLVTAILVEALRQMRNHQISSLERKQR